MSNIAKRSILDIPIQEFIDAYKETGLTPCILRHYHPTGFACPVGVLYVKENGVDALSETNDEITKWRSEKFTDATVFARAFDGDDRLDCYTERARELHKALQDNGLQRKTVIY